jgi:hypothetical protein
MKIDLIKVTVEGVKIELSGSDVMSFIAELEELKDLNLITSISAPVLWETSRKLKEKVIFDMQKLTETKV